MLRGLGAQVTPLKAAFDPQAGAHDHAHGHHHHHGLNHER
jgi:urease accessory protein